MYHRHHPRSPSYQRRNHSSRKAKLLKNAEAANWVAAGGRLEVWSWRKSSRAQRPQWICRTEAQLKDFIPEIP
jgi:hypothetical protein